MFDRDLQMLREAELREELANVRCRAHDKGVSTIVTQFESGHFEVQQASSVCCDTFAEELAEIVKKYQPH